MFETIGDIETHNPGGRGLFGVSYCMRSKTTLKHKTIVALVSSLFFFYRMRPSISEYIKHNGHGLFAPIYCMRP